MSDAPCWNPPIPSSTSCWEGGGATCNEEQPLPTPCPGCPPTGVWPDNAKHWLITPNVANALHGNLADDQREAFWQLKQTLLGFAGIWSVVQSSTATSLGAPGVDMWAAPSDIRRPGTSLGPYSWILLQRSDGVQLNMSITVDASWLEFSLDVSPSGLFAGGTAGNSPAATDNINIMRNGPGGGQQIYGQQNTVTGQQYYQNVWQSTDGTVTRLVAVGGAPFMTFTIARANNPDPGWTSPVVCSFQLGGANQVNPTTIMSIHDPNGVTAHNFMRLYATPGVCEAAVSVLPVLDSFPFANELCAKTVLYRSYISGGTIGARGLLGIVPDEWWQNGPDGHLAVIVGVYNNGPNYLAVFNSIVLPWIAGVIPQPGSVITTTPVGPFVGIA